MHDMPVIETERLVLRGWRAADHAPFAAMNADPRVMAFFPACLSRGESDAMLVRIHDHFAEHGFSFWAVGMKGGADFIGIAGLLSPRFEAHFTPCVEIGWRFAHAWWGQGYATEAARGLLRLAFTDFALDEVVALTVPNNRRSRRVMEKLGMTRDPADDFDHPALPPDHPQRRHVLYRLDRDRFHAGG